jgi:large subunit ribosomal protein L7Ae
LEIYKHLFERKLRDYSIGNDLQPKNRLDLTRFVKWPKYIQLQRQKRVLIKRLRIPPSIHQFSRVAQKPLATRIINFMDKYRPEDAKMKKERLRKAAEAKKKGEQIPETKKVPVVHSGINKVVSLIEKKQAQLVVLAHDVDPIDLVIYIPALCMKMDIPYAIIKSRSRLGSVVHQKNTACLALTDINKEDKAEFDQIVKAVRGAFNERYTLDLGRKWGGGVLSRRSRHAAEKALHKA